MDVGNILEFRSAGSRYVCEIVEVQYPHTAFAVRVRAGTTSPHLRTGDLLSAIVHYGENDSLVGGAVQFWRRGEGIVTGRIVEMSITFPEGPRTVDVRDAELSPVRMPRSAPRYVPYGPVAAMALISLLGVAHYFSAWLP